MNAPRLLLFDTASVYFRAFFGMPTSLRAPDGRPVNAVRGLLDYLARFITDYSPTHVGCCWDNSWRPAWRVALVPTYKAHRVAHGDIEEVPADLVAQVPLILDVLAALGIAVVGADGYEADDVIGTLAATSGMPTEVITGDRDLFQVVDDAAAVRVLYLGRGQGRHDRVDGAWLAERYGVTPQTYADFATLRGDPSDGLPGVPGIGEKTAASLLQRYGDLAGILGAAQRGELSAKQAASLRDSIDYLGAASEVVRVARRVPLGTVQLQLRAQPADPERFEALTAELNLGGTAVRVREAMAQARRT
ncbi:MAG: flap endonuclease [Actinobacteria bacterium HGW-Actinobacteria-2]|nr:MAG: flap endonuclease [Actinobacteria bacterium HGW-Actinobacteria-2]